MRKKLLLIAALFVSLMALSCPAYSYGGGGGGGGNGGGVEQEDDSFGGGAVSWAPNPNGADVIGSSIWRGRPESLEKGPYQKNKAVEDAEQDLLDGFRSGQYSAEEVKENLEWAQRVGIAISDQAKSTLESIVNPPPKPAVAAPQQSSVDEQKVADKMEKYLNIWADYNKAKEKNRATGKPTTKTDLAVVGLKNAIKGKVSTENQETVDKVFNFIGY
jgi:hypothetical protein